MTRTLRLAVLLLVAACSSQSNVPASESSSTTPAEADTDDGDEGAATWTPADAGVDDSVCVAKRTVLECERCCRSLRPGTSNLMYEAFRACECRKPERSCVDECGPTFCAASFDRKAATRRKGCLGCLAVAMDGPSKDCFDVTQSACAADEDCMQASRCTDRCSVEAGVP